MPSRSHSFSLRVPESDIFPDSIDESVSHDQRLHALETELDALQKLVCYLLEKNEYLRMRFQEMGEQF